MSSRERLLMGALIGILVAGVGGYISLKLFVEPLRDANSKIANVTREIEDAQALLDRYAMERPKLEAARKRSVPREREQAISQYNISYLQPMLAKSGLTVDDVSPLPAAVGDLKKTSHQLMMFQIRAKGELGDLVKAVRTIQATPFEHRVKELSIHRESGKDASTRLAITMMVEVLMVAKTENKDLPPADLDLTSLPSRNYDDIARKNIFVGALGQQEKVVWRTRPVKEPVEVVKEPEPEPEPQAPDLDVPAFVRLVTIDPTNKEAYLRNLVFRTRETKLIAKPGSGYEIFRVTDEDGSYVFLKAKVLRVGAREIYFQVYNQVYELHMGESLKEAMQFALSIDQLDDIELEYDRDWAKKEMDNKLEKAAKKKSSNKR